MQKYMENRDFPIGVFDSGIGGLTVVRQIHSLMPNESHIYLGDTARVPYGTKAPETIIRFACEDAQFLMDQKVKAIVVACNTASAWALRELERRFALPICGVITPGAETALIVSRNKRIGVIGTTATILSQAYTYAMKDRLQKIQVYSQACPLLVPLVEEGWLMHPITLKVLEEYLTPIVIEQIDTLILGCTHYPLLKRAIQQVIPTLASQPIELIDSAESCAQHLRRRLTDLDLLTSSAQLGTITPFFTDETPNFKRISSRFLGRKLPSATRVQLREYLL